MADTEALARVLARMPADPRKQAERILADPGPLLAALAEAGVLREDRARLRPCGCRRPVSDDWSVCCYPGTDRVDDAPQSRYVTEWRPADDR